MSQDEQTRTSEAYSGMSQSQYREWGQERMKLRFLQQQQQEQRRRTRPMSRWKQQQSAATAAQKHFRSELITFSMTDIKEAYKFVDPKRALLLSSWAKEGQQQQRGRTDAEAIFTRKPEQQWERTPEPWPRLITADGMAGGLGRVG